MFGPKKVVDIELSHPLTTWENLEGTAWLKGLVRLHGVPMGYVEVPVSSGRVSAKAVSKQILEQHSWKIISQLVQNKLAAGLGEEIFRLEDLFDLPPAEYSGKLPLVTVAVCTRERTSELALCLDALSELDYPYLDILVVDNAPTGDATARLVQVNYPHVRYVCEPCPGVSWARNRAIMEAKGEIIAYTDDDVVVDRRWVKALALVFAENPEVMAVTGLVVPYSLETEAQVLFEMQGGFGRGFERRWYRVGSGNKMPWRWLGTGQCGTGANMAYRHCLFFEIGYFSPALGTGTIAAGGEDLEMFFRVLKEGHTLVYEPRAIGRHCHRRDYEQLRSQLASHGGFYTYIVGGALAYPDSRSSFLWLGIYWMLRWHIRRLLISLIHPTRFPRDLILVNLWGSAIGLTRYHQSTKIAKQLAEDFGNITPVVESRKSALPKTNLPKSNAVALRTIELTEPLEPITDVTEYAKVSVLVTWNNSPLGAVEIANQQQPISRSRLGDVISNNLTLELLKTNPSYDNCLELAIAALHQRYTPTEEATLPTSLPADVPVSIVVATYDRPDDLRNCLRSLVAQKSPRQVEIIVVDNHPASNLTPPIVSEFPQVVLVSEPRQGLAYARNAGINTSRGDIVVTTDDDVTVPVEWLEKLVAPFIRADVMTVTGNVLPLELETRSQRKFEEYGGLGKGFNRFEVNGDWFESFRFRPVPTWILGGTANAAFRASIFNHPQIGLMYEALGAGMPSGVGEDTYIFYKVLKAGYTVVYEPTAYVWHKHRDTMAALYRQIYNYSKGHVAYHLTTLLEDGDWRGLAQILVGLPLHHARRITLKLLGRISYPLALSLVEIAGNLVGAMSLWRSRQRVKRHGISAPYLPVSQRETVCSQIDSALGFDNLDIV